MERHTATDCEGPYIGVEERAGSTPSCWEREWERESGYALTEAQRGGKMRLALLEIQPSGASGAHAGTDPLDTAPTTGHEHQHAPQHGPLRTHLHTQQQRQHTHTHTQIWTQREREDTYSWQAALQTASSAGHEWTSRKHRTVLEDKNTQLHQSSD